MILQRYFIFVRLGRWCIALIELRLKCSSVFGMGDVQQFCDALIERRGAKVSYAVLGDDNHRVATRNANGSI